MKTAFRMAMRKYLIRVLAKYKEHGTAYYRAHGTYEDLPRKTEVLISVRNHIGNGRNVIVALFMALNGGWVKRK